MTDLSHLESVVEAVWEQRAEVSAATHGEVRDAVETALALLDSGQARVASRGADGVWTTHQWMKKAVLLSFRLNDNQIMRAGAPSVMPLSVDHPVAVGPFWDKVPNKFGDWTASDYQSAGFRSVPGAIV
ncbi:MAG TPA: 2,3,4,5-tetrahydropyridine-2,6-dicarboxylate N-succinyltransferase, partial [Brevundimonas sp.]|nr:2,3,4,5-tetrahydropyridine-2,6-dicarboxylate N-succinyltransferase [Brevundimonas sp.]